jgi:hypothetical protein
MLREYDGNEPARMHALHSYAKELLDAGDVEKAWQVLLAGE